jgi:predicted Zn-dependent protease
VRAQRGDVASAARLVDEVLAREPLRATTRLNSARYHLQLGELDEAERQLEFLIARDPHDAAALATLRRVADAKAHREEPRP